MSDLIVQDIGHGTKPVLNGHAIDPENIHEKYYLIQARSECLFMDQPQCKLLSTEASRHHCASARLDEDPLRRVWKSKQASAGGYPPCNDFMAKQPLIIIDVFGLILSTKVSDPLTTCRFPC